MHKVIERRYFPVPKALKQSPLAPLESYWHPLASSSESWHGLHPSIILQMNPYNYVLNPPHELLQWARKRGFDIEPASAPSEGFGTNMPPSQSHVPNDLKLVSNMYGDVDESDSDTSSDPEADIETPEHIQNGTTNGQSHAYTGSFEEEDVRCLEDTGEYEEEEPFQHEKDELFGAIEDEEEREKHYKNWCEKVDQLELGYG